MTALTEHALAVIREIVAADYPLDPKTARMLLDAFDAGREENERLRVELDAMASVARRLWWGWGAWSGGTGPDRWNDSQWVLGQDEAHKQEDMTDAERSVLKALVDSDAQV